MKPSETYDELVNNKKIKKLVQKFSKAEQDQIKDLMFNVKLNVLRHDAPRNSEELWYCIKALWGVEYPYVAVTDYSNAPFEWFSDIYFGRAEASMAVGNRGSGKTLGGAFLHYLWGTFNPGVISKHAAATQEQASVAQSYLQQFSLDTALGQVFDKGNVSKKSARWKNNSTWSIVTGSMQGVSGQHPHHATWDEIEFWDVDAIEQSFAVPVSRDGHTRRWAAFSTRQRSYGAANWLVENADKKGIKVYLWTAFETMQRCPTCEALDKVPHGSDIERGKVCALWEDCHGKLGVKSRGWMPRKDVENLKKNLERRSWETQGLCTKPSNEGLVLHNFEHELEPKGNLTDRDFDPTRPWYAIYDPAEGKTSVIYFVQPDEDWEQDVIFDELIQKNCPDVTTAKIAFYEKCQEEGYGDPEAFVVDPHRTDAVATLKQGTASGSGINKKYNAVTPPTDEASGGRLVARTIDYLRRHICDGSMIRRLLVNKTKCKGCLRGVSEYHYPSNLQGLITSENPDKAYSDYVDPLRYWVMFRRHRGLTLGSRIRVI